MTHKAGASLDQSEDHPEPPRIAVQVAVEGHQVLALVNVSHEKVWKRKQWLTMVNDLESYSRGFWLFRNTPQRAN